MQRNYADTLPLTLLYRISRRGPSYLRNQQRRAFAKSARRVIFATKPPSSCLRTVESAAILPANSRRAGRELSRRGFIIAGLAARPTVTVVCSQYRLSKFQEEEDGRDEVNRSTGEPEVPEVNEDASATPITGCQHEASNQASSSDPWSNCTNELY